MKNKKPIFALFVALVCVFMFSVTIAVRTAYAEPLVYEYFSSKENCSVTYSKNKGWKIKTSNNSQETYMFTLNKSVLSYYVNKGYTNLEITFGNAFDDDEYAGAPVNCKAWVLPAESGKNGNYAWDYVLADRGFSTFYISGWNVRGEGRYSITVDLTNARYDFVNYGITFYLESKDVLGNFVGACFIHSVEFSGVTEEAPEVPENAVKLEKGAQVRMVSPIALGFVSRIDFSVYNNLKSTYGEQNVVVGTAIVSQKELVASGARLTVEDIDLYGLDYDNCIAKTFINSDTAEADGYYRFRAVKYIDSGYLTEKYAALSYIKVTTVLGISYYYYSDFSTEDNVRSALEVSSLAYSDLVVEQDEAYGNQVEFDEKVPENAGKYSPYKAEYREFLSNYLTAQYFVENGESSYKIVISQNATEVELLAAEFLKEKIAEATGADMPFVYDTETAGVKGRYISIGQNKLLEDAGLGSLAEQTVCDDGYIMKTVKNTLFIDGIIDRGTLYGVYDFLEQRLNYLLVSSECYTFIPTKNLEFCEIDVALSPTFTSRTYLEFEVMQGYTDPVTATFRRTNNFYLGSMDGYGGKEDVGYVGYDRVHNMQETIIEGVNLYNKIHDTFYNYAEYCIRYTNDNEHYIFMPCLTSGLDGEVGVLDFVFVAMKKLILEKYPLGIKY